MSDKLHNDWARAKRNAYNAIQDFLLSAEGKSCFDSVTKRKPADPNSWSAMARKHYAKPDHHYKFPQQKTHLYLGQRWSYLDISQWRLENSRALNGFNKNLGKKVDKMMEYEKPATGKFDVTPDTKPNQKIGWGVGKSSLAELKQEVSKIAEDYQKRFTTKKNLGRNSPRFVSGAPFWGGILVLSRCSEPHNRLKHIRILDSIKAMEEAMKKIIEATS